MRAVKQQYSFLRTENNCLLKDIVICSGAKIWKKSYKKNIYIDTYECQNLQRFLIGTGGTPIEVVDQQLLSCK